MNQYFDVHVLITRTRGYSIPVKIQSNKLLTDENVIEFCKENRLFEEKEDCKIVDYVTEMEESEYKEMKNI